MELGDRSKDGGQTAEYSCAVRYCGCTVSTRVARVACCGLQRATAGPPPSRRCEPVALRRGKPRRYDIDRQSTADNYSALKSRGTVACICARCCGRNPNKTTPPGFMSIETTAARPAISSSPRSQPDATMSVFRTLVIADAQQRTQHVHRAGRLAVGLLPAITPALRAADQSRPALRQEWRDTCDTRPSPRSTPRRSRRDALSVVGGKESKLLAVESAQGTEVAFVEGQDLARAILVGQDHN
jgi:hypothetical protein